MIERHHDYILNVASIPAGGSIQSYPLTIDADAPFCARGRGLHIAPPTSTRSQSNVQLLRFRFKNAKGEDLAQIPVQTPADFAGAYGVNGIYRPIYPQQVYPPGGNILVDVFNDGPTAITNLQVIFRGVKLFRDGAIPNPTYPQTCVPRDYTYQTGKGTPTDAQIVLATTSSLRQIPLLIQADADFVLRAGQVGLWTSSGASGTYSPFGYTELFVQLFDRSLKPYSNLPIHIDWLFGNAGGTTLPGFTKLGNAAPGLLVPEIYLPKSTALYFDLFRTDSAYTGVTDSLPVRLSMAWIGSKIYS
jgi:hypothetical protein